jgi:hypothetical protein
MFGKDHVKRCTFLASLDLKREPISAPVTTRKGSNFENSFLTWVYRLRPSDLPGFGQAMAVTMYVIDMPWRG